MTAACTPCRVAGGVETNERDPMSKVDAVFGMFKAMPRDAQARMVDAMKADARERWTQADIAAFPADIRAKLVKHGVLPA